MDNEKFMDIEITPLNKKQLKSLIKRAKKYKDENIEKIRRALKKKIEKGSIRETLLNTSQKYNIDFEKLEKDVIDQVALAVAMGLPHVLLLDEVRIINNIATRKNDTTIDEISYLLNKKRREHYTIPGLNKIS